MFRTLFRRPPAVKVAAQNGMVEMQRVEIRRQPSKASSAVRRFVLNTILFYCAFHTIKFWMYGPDPEVQKRYEELRKQRAAQKSQEKQASSVTGSSKGHHSSGEAAQEAERIVIPIYGWIKQLEPKKPSSNDPDLKAFVALRDDERAVAKLHDDIFQAVRKQIKNSKAHSRNINTIQFDGRYRNDLHFGQMLQPPPYAMRCIILEPGKTALGWKELSPSEGARMQRLQHPLLLAQAFFNGLWAFTTTTVAISQAKLLDTMVGQEKWSYRIFYQTQKGRTRYIGYVNPTTREQAIVSKLPSYNMNDEQVKKLFPFLKGSFGQGTTKDSFRSTTQSMMHDSVLQHAVHIFKHQMLSGRHQAQAMSTPGTVPIIGFFDFMGTHGIYRVEIMALYVVREHAFLGPVMITDSRFLYQSPQEKQLPKPSPDQQERRSAASDPVKAPQASKQPEPESGEPQKGSSPSEDAGK
jgi:hypothetical protein